MSHTPSPTPWTPGPRRELARTRVFTLCEQRFDCVDHPERSGDFSVIVSNDWCNTIAVTDDPEPRIVLVEQFRFGLARNTLEIPGGFVDTGEAPLDAAARELLEETGYAGDPGRTVNTLDANPAFMTNRFTVVLIENCRRVAEPSHDQHEQTVARTAPLRDVAGMIARGEIAHSVVVAAIAALTAESGAWRERLGLP